MVARSLWRCLLFVASVAVTTPMAAGADIYDGREAWGATFPYPPGLSDCIGVYYGQNHGPIMFLDPSDTRQCDDDGNKHRRVISMFNFYNTTEDTATLRDLLDFTCEKKCVPLKNGPAFNGFPSLSGRSDHDDGWIELAVVTHGGRDRFGDENVVNYTLWLWTDRQHFEADFRLFKSILASISLKPPHD